MNGNLFVLRAHSSNSNFAITVGTLIVTAPNGGQNWVRGTTHTITWSKTGSPGSYVKIKLLKAVRVQLLTREDTKVSRVALVFRNSFKLRLPRVNRVENPNTTLGKSGG